MANSEQAGPAVKFPGLTAAQVEESRRKHGENLLTPPERDPWWQLFLDKFDDPVIRILIIAAVIAIMAGAAHGEYIEGIAIIVAILLATTLAFINEYQAAKEFDVLNKVSDGTPVRAVRDAKFVSVPRKDLVVGDVVFLETGEEIPADATVLEAVSAQVNESRLTGESVPVSKLAEGTPDPDASHRAYPAAHLLRSTNVVDGYVSARITAVGDATEIGKAARAATEETGEETPLNRQLERLSKVIGVVGLGVAVATYVILLAKGAFTKGELDTLTAGQWNVIAAVSLGTIVALVKVWLPIVFDLLAMLKIAEPPAWLDGPEDASLLDGLKSWAIWLGLGLAVAAIGLGLTLATGGVPFNDSAQWLPEAASSRMLKYFMIAVTIIVVAVPEGLAMSVTLSLAYSMRRMAASNILVRQMHACETIGAATVICSDKTGTLTMNEMRARSVVLLGNELAELDEITDPALKRIVIEAFAVNTTAHLNRREKGPSEVLGNPTEGALLLWLESRKVNYLDVRLKFKIADQATFTTERKFMATAGAESDGTSVVHVKGAPEIVLGRCKDTARPGGPIPLDDAERTAILARLKEFQKRGMRTLGLAYRLLPDGAGTSAAEALSENLVWLGFAAIEDPIRPEVPGAVETCLKAGVGVKVVTGDNRETAQEIARQIGLWKESDGAEALIEGAEFAALSDDEARARVLKLKVVARARPMDKMRLVRLLQENQQVVAVTGDGTNDAPALNYANVGLSMGKTGTAVAKEASDIVLLDDSFRSIANSVMWGRSLYENIQRFILFQLTINVVALTVAVVGPLVGVALPLTVIQMLWVNLIMDTFAALALATEPPHEEVMDRKPRHPDDFIVTPAMGLSIFGIGAFFTAILLGMLFWYKAQGVDFSGLADHHAKPSQDMIEKLSIFFSVFVMMQFWNLFNARCLGRHESALSGLTENRAFLGIAVAIAVGQILIVQFGGQVFRTAPLGFGTWVLILLGTSPVLLIGEGVRWLQRQAAAKAAAPAPAAAS